MKFFDKIFKKPDSSTPNDLTTITRTETLEGFAIPGIIWNNQYYFTDIQIYRDGVVNCWKILDLAMFKDNLKKNWVVTSIPDGEKISIFGLGSWIIENGKWDYNKDTFYDYIRTLVKRLNPKLENLYRNNSKVERNANAVNNLNLFPKPYFYENPTFFLPKMISGEKFHIFYRNEDGKTYLATLSIYPNGHIEITNLPNKKCFTFEHLSALISSGQLISELKIGESISIMGLGSFTIKSGEGIDINFKYNEFLGKYNELNGAENSIEKCRRIFEAYKQNPTLSLKQELKIAYESVPEHQRIFVGTMETKDYDVRRAIYKN